MKSLTNSKHLFNVKYINAYTVNCIMSLTYSDSQNQNIVFCILACKFKYEISVQFRMLPDMALAKCTVTW